MTVSGTFLVVITASFLKPLLSTNQSLQLPTEVADDQYSNVVPLEEPNGVNSNLFLTLRLPQLLANANDMNLDAKRQFDPWGGKRQLKSEDENVGRKRQFSPWGGKRSSLKSSQLVDEDLTDADARSTGLYLRGNKRSFNSWGGKRGFNSWGGKRSANSDTGKRFNAWGGKRNFNAWGGKRSADDLDKNFEPLIPKKNAVMGSKRQAFNSWGGKRSFNSWGGKRAFNSWGNKRDAEFEKEQKELNSPEDYFISQIYKDVVGGTETNIR